MLTSKGVDCEISNWLERVTKHSLQRCGNLFGTDVVLKTMKLTTIHNRSKQIINMVLEQGSYNTNPSTSELILIEIHGQTRIIILITRCVSFYIVFHPQVRNFKPTRNK